MKRTQRLISGLVVGAVALAMVSTLAAQSTEGTAKVIRIKGSARYSVGNNVWQPLKLGAVLKPGTIVQTSNEKGAFVDVVLSESGATVPIATAGGTAFQPFIPSSMMTYQPTSEQNIVRIWENSALGIDKLSYQQTGADRVSETQLDLKAGRILANVKKMSAASRYEVKLPNGVAGIRGTVADIWAVGLIRVLIGSVVYAYLGSDGTTPLTQVVQSNQQFDIPNGLQPINGAALQELNRALQGMRFFTGLTPTIYTSDQTIYISGSPTTGTQSSTTSSGSD